MRVKFGQI